LTLTAKDIAEITRLVEQSSFDEFYLEFEGLKLSFKRAGASADAPSSASIPAATLPQAAASGAPNPAIDPNASTAAAPAPPAGPSDAQEVCAPLLGTFYRAPKPGAPPFVELGSPVEEDSIIGIIEVMKLMNTVRAGVRGRVTEILARDGELVEYGELLLRVGRSD
jgi:acetyl-CoA carboxylase biotin carboxyl carrier protein